MTNEKIDLVTVITIVGLLFAMGFGIGVLVDKVVDEKILKEQKPDCTKEFMEKRLKFYYALQPEEKTNWTDMEKYMFLVTHVEEIKKQCKEVEE